jgi:uncharacterized protein (DUF2267 family)
MLVLRKGRIHKDRFTTEKQVGLWRHRVYKRCGTFALAMNLFSQLRKDTTTSFHHENQDQRAPWWDNPVIDFETYNEESSAMQQVLRNAGVGYHKTTHHHSQAVQAAGAESMQPYQIHSIMKHLVEKMNKSYQSECDREMLKVMAGFGKLDSYFEPMQLIPLEGDIRYYLRLLIPKYDDWLHEVEEPDGDKSQAAATFLKDVLPYLCQVLVQCGAFFIEDCPNHEMVIYLKVRILENFETIENFEIRTNLKQLTSSLFFSTRTKFLIIQNLPLIQGIMCVHYAPTVGKTNWSN